MNALFLPVSVISQDDFLETRRRSNTFDETSSVASRRPSTKEKKPLQRLLSDKSQHMNSVSAPEVSKVSRGQMEAE